jgi:hypothetical protein
MKPKLSKVGLGARGKIMPKRELKKKDPMSPALREPGTRSPNMQEPLREPGARSPNMQEPLREPGIPEDMALELENKRKDKLVKDEYEGGEKARKKNMGEIGFKSGGSVGSASKRADGCAQRGKTKGRMI